VPGGEAGDAGSALRVQEQKQPRDPAGQGQGAVVQEPSCVIPAFLGIERADGALPAGLVEGQAAGVPAGKCPADEVAGLLGIVNWPSFTQRSRSAWVRATRVSFRPCTRSRTVTAART
jgi:hypothetical protein